MVFIPLVGIDNHWKSVTFGAILLEKEDNDNYIWACESFKKVFVKNPKCIITDQDLAMKVALQTCFPLVKHRLCMWHIMKKFPSKVEYCLSTVLCTIMFDSMCFYNQITTQFYICLSIRYIFCIKQINLF